MKKIEVSRATLGRIPTYIKYLKNSYTEYKNISATTLAKELSLGEVQVRKDLAAISGAGRPKTGYNVTELLSALEDVIKSDGTDKVVIVGAGKLGRALLDYTGFREYGLDISAAFDIAVTNTEYSHTGKPIYNVSRFSEFCENNNVKIGIIAVPSNAAQQVCDMLVENGVRGIWCFAPCVLSVNSEIPVQYENMGLSLAYLNKEI